MAVYEANNTRLAKNTMFLYVRMIFIMAVTFYTSRVVLKVLGVEDFGIFNVVAGIVAMFGFLNSSMSASTQRFISFSLGKGDKANLNKIFSTCVLTHAMIGLAVLVLIESIGLWFLYNKMIIPEGRMDAAFWVFQFSALSTVVAVMSIPFNADIIAHEKMSAFAYISLVEVCLKLLIVFLLGIGGMDKLVTYGFLLLLVQCGIFLTYMTYCLRHFKESHFRFIFEKNLFAEVSSFAGWNMWGYLSSVMSTQGLNLLLNSFFGPVVNAARGLAYQADGAIRLFASNFQMAINPQIVKTYAADDLNAMHKLVFRSSKFSYFLLLALSLPVMIETRALLELWLVDVPDWTVVFLRLMLIVVIVDSVANPFMTAATATGRVKVYQSVVGGIQLLIVPIAYLVLKLGGNPCSVFVVHICVCVVAFVVRFVLVRYMVGLSAFSYFKEVVMRCLFVTFVAAVLPLGIYILFPDTIVVECVVVVLSTVSALLSSFFVGLTQGEREFVKEKSRTFIDKIILKNK